METLYPIGVEFGDKIEVGTTTTETPPIYPSQWFLDHPNSKPILNVYKLDVGECFVLLDKMREATTWNDILVATFMCHVLRENPEHFSATNGTEAWTSDNLTICDPGAVCTPLNILSVVEVPLPTDVDASLKAIGKGPHKTERPERRAHFMSMLLIYRKALIKNTNENYFNMVSARMNDHFSTSKIGLKNEMIQKWDGYYTSDKLTPNYVMIVSALDMFYFKFPTHEYSNIRLATLPTRYRGCVALTSLEYISRTMGISASDLCRHAITRNVAVDIVRICKPGESMTNTYGYFPYQMGFSLTTKSPYSAAVNPTLHMWLHTIGCIYTLRRSMTAVKPDNVVDLAGTVNSAVAVALLKSKGGLINIQFAKTAKEQKETRELIEQANRQAADIAAAAAAEKQLPPADEDAGVEDDSVSVASGTPGSEEAPPPIPVLKAIVEDNATKGLIELIINFQTCKGLNESQLAQARDRLKSVVEVPVNSVGHYLKSFYAKQK